MENGAGEIKNSSGFLGKNSADSRTRGLWFQGREASHRPCLLGRRLVTEVVWTLPGLGRSSVKPPVLTVTFPWYSPALTEPNDAQGRGCVLSCPRPRSSDNFTSLLHSALHQANTSDSNLLALSTSNASTSMKPALPRPGSPDRSVCS